MHLIYFNDFILVNLFFQMDRPQTFMESFLFAEMNSAKSRMSFAFA